MPSSIETLLNQIANARFGEQVRTAIHDSIAQCYSDVSNGVTGVEAAIQEAAEVKVRFNADADAAEEALSDLSEYTQTMQEKLDEATGFITDWTKENGYKNKIEYDINAAETVVSDWTGTYKPDITTAITNAQTYGSAAQTAANEWNDTYKPAVDSATRNAQTIVNSWNDTSGYKKQIEDGILGVNTAVDEWTKITPPGYKSQIETLIYKIENLSVKSESVGPNDAASAIISDVTDAAGTHKQIKFFLRQGAPGAPFAILGHVYDTISDLLSDITNPSEGDMYTVKKTGSNDPPYDVWRYTGDPDYGSYNGWENQGSIGGAASISNLSDTEVDSLWAGNTLSVTGSKYITHNGLYHLINNDTGSGGIKYALNGKVDKVPGKVLTDVNFTQELSDQIGTNQTNIAANTAAITAMQNKVITVTLDKNQWNPNTKVQSVTNALFVTSGKAYLVEPTYDDIDKYTNADIVAFDVASNETMTFKCTTIPTSNIRVKILCMAVDTT